MMPNISKSVAEAKAIAKDDRHGYSQSNRKGKPDYDCSSLVIHCLDAAGFPMSKYGATYTGNMIKALKKCGFKDVTKKINLRTGKGMEPGDVFINPGKHTAIAVSKTKLCAAHSNYDGKPGDGSGLEINTYSYKNYGSGWEYVFRYEDPIDKPYSVYSVAQDVINGEYGTGNARREALKAAGYNPDAVQEAVNNIYKYRYVALDVVNGKYGSGEERKKLLTDAGYPYGIVQDLVNAYLRGDIRL